MNEAIPIESTDFWVKIIQMLQQNWAVIENRESLGVIIYFIDDTSHVFDEIAFPTRETASASLAYTQRTFV